MKTKKGSAKPRPHAPSGTKAKPTSARRPSLDVILARAHARDEELRKARKLNEILRRAHERDEARRQHVTRKLSDAEREIRKLKKQLAEARETRKAELTEARRAGRAEAIKLFYQNLVQGQAVDPANRVRAVWREVEAMRASATKKNPFAPAFESWAIRNNFSVSLIWAEYRKRHPWRGSGRLTG